MLYTVRGSDVAPGMLSTMARPRGGDWLADDLAALRAAGVTAVASALTPAEADELGLCDEPAACAAQAIAFLPVPVPDRGLPPSRRAVDAAAAALAARVRAGEHVAVHCRQGIGRASLLASAVLVHLGVPAGRALALLEAARGRPIPDTPEQREWVLAYERGRAAVLFGAADEPPD
jgi:protein-tyrosine phosphatase